MINALVLLLFVSLLFGLLLFAFLGTFSRLMADDFCYFANAKELGIWKGLTQIYATWSGRYSTIALIMLLEPAAKFAAQAAPGAILLAWLIALITLFVGIIQKVFGDFPRSLAWVMAAMVLFLTCLIAPNRFQVLFWLNGSITYTLPLVTITALVYWALRMIWQERKPNLFFLALFSLGLVISAGFSETTSVLQFTLFALALIYTLIRKLPQRSRLIFGLGTFFSLLAMLALIVSPGNHARQALFPAPPAFFQVIWLSFRYGLAFIFHTLIGYPLPILFGILVAVMMGLLLARTRLGDPAQSTLKANRLWAYAGLSASAGMILIVSTCAPSVYAQSAYPEPRALFPATYILILGIVVIGFLSGFAIGCWERTAKWLMSKGFETLLAAGLILACLYPLRAGAALDPAFRQARGYADTWDARLMAAITYPRNEKTALELRAINSQYGISELETDPAFWVNQCFARYYDLAGVTAK